MSWLLNRHYDRAPIKEAIVDIQIERPPSLTLASLEGAPPGYGQRQMLMMGQVRIPLGAGQVTPTAKQDQMGYRFVSGDGKHVAQFRVDGFTFSRLAPYQTWQQLQSEAKLLWEAYRRWIVGQLTVVRVGLRYVNQLDLPLPVRDFRDFIRSYPEISSDLPQQLAGFFMQLQVPQEDIDAMLVINEAMVPPPSPGLVSIVLDIDVFRQGLKLESSDDVWDVLEVLRLRKNLVFEGCITNNARELIS